MKSSALLPARTWSCIGLALAVAGLLAVWRQMIAPIDVYDEGLVLSYADQLLHGAVPYRDFYSNYPPGVFLLVAGWWHVVGASVLSERVLGLSLQILLALLSGRLAARAVEGSRRFSMIAFGATFLWLRHAPIWPTAWMSGLAFALLAVELALRAGPSRARWFAAGVCFGIAGTMRHDLFVYASILIVALVVAVRVFTLDKVIPPARMRAMLVAGIVLPLALVGGWIVWKAGVRQPWLDLYFDQVHSMLPGRRLPFPPLWKPTLLATALWVGFAAPLIGLVMLARGRRSVALLALVALSLAALPQMTQRTDVAHVLCGLTPGLAILACALEGFVPGWSSRVARTVARCVLVVLLLLGVHGIHFRTGRSWVPLDLPRTRGISASDSDLAVAQRHVVEFVQAHTAPDEHVLVGNHQHARVFISEMELYFLCDRRGAVRRMQFDPNLSNRLDEQEKMIAELEARATRVVVLAPDDYPPEPNDSAKVGSARFDEFLRSRYALAERAGPYELLLRAP